MMETEEPQDRRRQKGGHYCIALGCKNEFYKVKSKDKTVHIHFHKLPLKRRTVLLHWLVTLKQKSPPMSSGSRVCSEHFLEEDYTEGKIFDSGKLLVRRTTRLKPEAALSVFSFTGYNLCFTDRPTYSDNSTTKASVCRKERALKCASQAGKRQVRHLATHRNWQVPRHQLCPFQKQQYSQTSVTET